jgi:hypothetical protein
VIVKLQVQTETSWTKSVGVMSKKPLSGLVRLKKSDASTATKPEAESKKPAETSSVPAAPDTAAVASATSATSSNVVSSSINGEIKKSTPIQSLVGAYSDSDNSDSN